jgi:hypothetical protein
MKVKYNFSVKTNKADSQVDEIVELEFEDMSDEEMERRVDEAYNDWMWQNISTDIEEIID